MNLIKTKIDNAFSDLTFEESAHKYFVKDQPLKISVSGLIERYVHPVDWETVRAKSALKHNKTEEEIQAEWDAEADLGCSIGNEAHLFGELYPFNKDMKPATGYDRAIVKFWADLPDFIVPLYLELRMYHKEFMFAGTADIILFNTRTNQFIIADYKTNKDLHKHFRFQRMTGPFSHLVCSPFNHYQLQLSYYQILLQQILGIEVFARYIIWLREDGEYTMHGLDDYTSILKTELLTHKF